MSTTESKLENLKLENKQESKETKLDQIKILVAGQADSSKSTTIGVLVNDQLDTSDEPMATKVDRYIHEKKSGMTSSVSSHYMLKNGRVIEFYNLCGQQKYLKTTLYGISSVYGDYGILLVNINRGLTDMGLEHLSILVHLRIPFFVLITKIDLCLKEQMYIDIHNQLRKELKKFKKSSIPLRVDKEYNITENYLPYIDVLMQKSDVVPILCMSNRTGKNKEIVQDFIMGLKSRPLWKESDIVHNVFFITTVFSVKHVGIVVSGIVKSKNPIRVGDHWYVGPYDGKFLQVRIKSIHNDIRQDVDELTNGESGCICIKFIGKDMISKHQFRKGMILTDNIELIKSNIVNEFTARVMILQHHTSVKTNFQSVIHLGPIRQTAVISCDHSCLRTGDVAVVKFKWLIRPEYVELGTRFFGREGNCRFSGEVISLSNDKE